MAAVPPEADENTETADCTKRKPDPSKKATSIVSVALNAGIVKEIFKEHIDPAEVTDGTTDVADKLGTKV
jgi:hypothetical protein